MARFERKNLPPINRDELLLDASLLRTQRASRASRVRHLDTEIMRCEGRIADELLKSKRKNTGGILDMLGAQLVEAVKQKKISEGRYDPSTVRAELEARFERLTRAVKMIPKEETLITRASTRVHHVYSEIEVPVEITHSPQATRVFH